MTAVPVCMTCNLERTLIDVKRGRNRHDVRQYECDGCKDIFTLVSRRAHAEDDDLVFGFPSLQTCAR